MRVNVLRNLGWNEFPDNPLQEGEHEVNEEFGARLIARGLADDITPPEDKFEKARKGHRKSEPASE